ncbi:MAG: hypothetical protein R3E53_13025 [Myxococcota bacterium]
MHAQRRSLLLLIVLGGSAVLGSYVLAFVVEPAIRAGLWGGIPEGGMRSFYTTNMFLAAASFFPTTWLLGFATQPEDMRARTGLPFETMLGAYAAILMPSALWLPLTALYIREPSALLWLGIRIDLFAVGLGATLLGWMAFRRARRPRIERVAAATFFFFWLQTMVLDALVWPWYYPTA